MPYSLFRLLELSGRLKLSEALSPQQAAAIFISHGADQSQMGNPSYLKQFRLSVNKASHPDKGGDGKAAAEVNAAYDVIKAGYQAPAGRESRRARADTGDDLNKAGRDWMRSKMAGDKPSSPKKSWPQGNVPRRNDRTRNRLYVFTNGALEHLDDVTGGSDYLKEMIENLVKNGDLTKDDVILANQDGWCGVEVIFINGRYRMSPQVVDREDDGPLDRDAAFQARLPQMIEAISRYESWHSVSR
ncbi:MAG: hypothetical protein EOP83_04440 [Verrucomicrobiaceae bacterium]|nr:MAG: hypothetical protein EOP83_04440 [Verrucomicrobiaceae bacterium]